MQKEDDQGPWRILLWSWVEEGLSGAWQFRRVSSWAGLGVVHRRGAEAPRAAEGSLNELTERVIGAAIEVHRCLGPGLLESIYQTCLAREMELRAVPFQREAGIAAFYKGVPLPVSFRVDFLIQDQLIVEVKAVESLVEVHTAQLLTYLKLTDLRLGLLINFNVPALWRGVRRVANNL